MLINFWTMTTVISGTNRSNSNSIKVARACCDILSQKGVDNQLFSLNELPVNFISENIYNNHSTEFTELVNKYFESTEKFVFIIPEYNGSYPGVLKIFIDSVDYLIFKGKRACLIGLASGHSGALRSLDHFTDVLHHLNVEVMSNKTKLSNIESLIDGETITDQVSIKRISEAIDQFIQF